MGGTEWRAEGSVLPRQTLQPDTGRKPGAGTPPPCWPERPVPWAGVSEAGRRGRPQGEGSESRPAAGASPLPGQEQAVSSTDPTASGCWDGCEWTVGAPYSVPAVAWASRSSTRLTPGCTRCPGTWDQGGDTLVAWAGSLAPWKVGLKPLAEDSWTTNAVGASLRRGRPLTPIQP